MGLPDWCEAGEYSHKKSGAAAPLMSVETKFLG
jgi:hypothetical protein